MDLSIITEFIELFKKFDGLQEKLFEKNLVLGMLTLKAIIKLLEGLLQKLKAKEEILLKEQEDNSSKAGKKINQLASILNKINL